MTGHPRHLIHPAGGLLRSDGPGPRRWFSADGAPVTDPATLERLRRLAVPPAWTAVWASADPEAPVQATGVDARGRTQYRYSAAATAAGSHTKFAATVRLGGCWTAASSGSATTGTPATTTPTA